MPGSVRENDADVIKFVQDHDIKTVIDIGTGRGTYSDLLREHVDRIDGVEAWKPYVVEFKLYDKYDNLFINDVRHLDIDFANYDMVIFGDVLEHMDRADSLALWGRATRAGYGLISVPIIHYPQGAEFGNPYEVHVQEHMHVEDILRDYGPFVFHKEYEITGTFIARF
jgi:predicted TPR repeat methyltransferase